MKEKWLWWIVVLAGVAAGVIYVIRTPVKGKISYNPDKSPTPSPMEYIRYDGSDISFSYENKYELRENGPSIELVGNAGVSGHIVISVNSAKSGDIEEVPGVLMRRLKPDEYIENKINWGNTEGVLFEHVGSFELTVFFLKNDKAITVAMTANSNDEEKLINEFDKLVDSMQIKEWGGLGGN